MVEEQLTATDERESCQVLGWDGSLDSPPQDAAFHPQHREQGQQ